VGEISEKLPPGQVVAVLPFLDPDGGVRRLGVLAAEEVERVLLARGRRLTDRQHTAAVLREQDLQLALAPSVQTAQRAGRMAGADLLLLGSLSQTGRGILLSLRLIEVRTGRPLAVSGAREVPAAGLGELLWYVRRPAGADVAGELPPLSLRYELVSPRGAGETAFADGSTVASGQRFKLRIQANSDCCLYVLLYDSQGKAVILFPHRNIELAGEIRGGVSYEIPAGTTWYWFDDRPGTETFYIVGSYGPLADLDGLVKQMQQAGDVRSAAEVRRHIEKEVVRGMSPPTAGRYQPKGLVVKDRGVGGVVDIGWGRPAASTADLDHIVSGHATVVKKVVLNHR
jgi:hypothetical protein